MLLKLNDQCNNRRNYGKTVLVVNYDRLLWGGILSTWQVINGEISRNEES